MDIRTLWREDRAEVVGRACVCLGIGALGASLVLLGVPLVPVFVFTCSGAGSFYYLRHRSYAKTRKGYLSPKKNAARAQL